MSATLKKDIMVYALQDISNLNDQLANAGTKLVVIDFYAVWLGPCKMIALPLEDMSKTMTDVVFLKVNRDDWGFIAAKYNITAMPTFIFLKNKKKIADLTGANVDKLIEMVAPNK